MSDDCIAPSGSMSSPATKISLLIASHLLALFVGAVCFYLVFEPVSLVRSILFGDEIHSRSSFPREHMARIYSVPGIGDQQLLFFVDGKRVYRTPDFRAGNVNEGIEWDESGKSVRFVSSGKTIYTYNVETDTGFTE